MIRIVSLSLLLLSAVAQADERPDIRHLMSAAEYQAAGLDRLDPDQVDALNDWLWRFQQGRVQPPSSALASPETADRTRPERQASARTPSDADSKEEPERIRSRIVGDFSGWDGKTVFRLENGQVWRQRTTGKYYITAKNPEVELYRNWLGLYWLRLVDTGKSVGVKRVE